MIHKYSVKISNIIKWLSWYYYYYYYYISMHKKDNHIFSTEDSVELWAKLRGKVYSRFDIIECLIKSRDDITTSNFILNLYFSDTSWLLNEKSVYRTLVPYNSMEVLPLVSLEWGFTLKFYLENLSGYGNVYKFTKTVTVELI